MTWIVSAILATLVLTLPFNTFGASAEVIGKKDKVEIETEKDGTKLISTLDAKGNQIECLQLNKDGTLQIHSVSSYDKEGRRTFNVVYDPSGAISYSTFDNKGRRIELVQRDNTGKIHYWELQKYDDAGKEIESTIKKSDGSVDVKFSYSYNDQDDLKESNQYNADGSLRQQVVYSYDKDGKWLKGDIFDSNGAKIGEEQTMPEHWLYGSKKRGKI